MIKTTLAVALALLALAACRHPQPQQAESRPDYGGLQQRSDAAQQELDQQSK